MDIETMAAMDEAGRQVKETLRVLKAHRRVTDAAIAEQLGLSQPTVNRYFSGATRLTVETLVGLAAALDVPPHVLLMRADDALGWVLEHRPNRSLATSGGSIASISLAEVVEPKKGIEPLTFSLRVRCSAD